jgi:hypothetical protein
MGKEGQEGARPMRTLRSTEEEQIRLCKKFGVEFRPSPEDLKVGVARNVRSGIRPINGLRHPPTESTTGWFIWAGEDFSTAPDFFVPLHAKHLEEWCPAVLKYLGLPPGWRFLIADGYEDVWYDDSLLDT